MTVILRILTPILLAGLISAQGALSQTTSFGKNKVQYQVFDWHYIQSTHFDIYFDKGDENIAAFTAAAAESAYVSISKNFRYRITARIPFVVYDSHNRFQQTNVVSSYLEEGIGGVTELFKNRIVVPFEGDYKKFRHVIHHELVHAVINDMFYGGSIQSIISNNITLQLPLWFNEGLAEYEALGWDTNSDMFIRDATLNSYLPPIKQLGGYFAYRGGQSVWNYIAGKYGPDEIGDILNRVRGSRNIDAGFKGAIGLDVEELSEKWTKEQKILYWPDIAKRKDPGEYSRSLTDHRKENAFYNTSPTISPSGDRIAFISDRNEYFEAFLMSSEDGTIIRKLISGQQTADFEELHLLTPGMSWSPDSRRLALTTKSGEQDAIILLDVEGSDREKLEFDLDGIFSVDWAPLDSVDRLAFIGIKSGQSDVYVYDLGTKVLTNLTDDIFSDSDPAWSPDGRSVVFASDRGDMVDGKTPPGFRMQDFDYSETDLYRIDAGSRVIERLTNYPGSSETSPAATPDGRHLFFISDLNGINNIYVMDFDSGRAIRPITNSISGVYQLSISQNGEKLAFSSLHNAGFDIYLLRAPLDQRLEVAELEKTEYFRVSRGLKTGTAKTAPDTLAIGGDILLNTSTENASRREQEAGVNLRNHVFRDRDKESQGGDGDSSSFPEVTGNVDSEGNYTVTKYKLNFSPDLVYGSAGYNTFYGIEGSTIMAFSDMLGDHQIYVITNLLFDLRNSDYALAYLYLPLRIDYGVQAFHSARAVYVRDQRTGIESLNRFRNYGVNMFALYPITKFQRIDLGMSLMNVRRENLDIPTAIPDESFVVLPSFAYVDDTSLWGMIAPSTGRRFNFSTIASPGLTSTSPSFFSFTADYRRYERLGPYYTFMVRFAGGGSFGKDPQKFIVGGVEGWVNPRFQNNSFPIETADDYLFLTTGVPLRGYNYNARNGTRYGLFNTEMRFPLFGYFSAGPLPIFFQTFTGSLFLDVGTAWTVDKELRLFERGPGGQVMMRDLMSGMGYGVRSVFFGFLLKMDVAWAFNWQRFSAPQYYFSVGADI